MTPLLCLVLAAAAGLRAQQPAAADQLKPKPAIVYGRVTDSLTGRPLRMARVRAVLESRSERVELSTLTDDDGRYRLDDVPAGRYVLAASKARYMTLQHGQRPPAPSGRPIAIAAAAARQIDFALPRAAAITGRVVDEFGDPIERAVVSAMTVGYPRGRRGFAEAATASTNDAGEYRIAGLAPGDYYVLVSERSDSFGVAADADVGFLQTMYPAATMAADARPVTVSRGQDLGGIDVSLTPARTATLSGLAVTSRGQPATNLRVNLFAVDAPFGLGGETTTSAEGRFTFPRVLPGRYELHVRKPGFSNRPGDEPEAAIVPITASGADLADLNVLLTRGGRLTGTVVPPENATAAPRDVTLVATPIGDTLVFGVGFGGALQDDWTFDWPYLIAPRIIRAQRVPPGWYVSAVLRGGDDITDTPTVFRDPDEVRILMAADAATLAGSATTPNGGRAEEYTAIVFPDDESKWTHWSRFIAAARADQQGEFRIESLPPGAYLVAAVEQVERDRWLNAEFLRALKPLATAVRLEPAGRQSIALRLVKP